MDIRINVSCRRCNCGFALTSGRFSDRGALSCPNCGATLAADTYATLCTALLAFRGLSSTEDFSFKLVDEELPF